MKRRTVVGCLGIVGLALCASVLVALNWDAVSDALDDRSRRVSATLFRLGELLSMKAELEVRFGSRPDMTYDAGDGVRVLAIVFKGYRPPEDAAPRDHAYEIAAFALQTTSKREEVDVIEVSFRVSADDVGADAGDLSGPFSFKREELMRSADR